MRSFALAAAPLSFLACSFVLDFDELEEGHADRIGLGGASMVSSGGEGPTSASNASVGGSDTGEAGADPTTGTGGAGTGGSGSGGSGTGGAGAGGSGVFEQCETDCDDGDPCTRDFCDTTLSPAECGNESRQGVFDDGFSLSLTAETFHRATLISGQDQFYLSAFRSSAGMTETTLYSIPREAEEIVEHFRVSDLGEGNPASAIGLVVDANDGFVLQGYVGLLADAGERRVNHLRFDDLSAPTSSAVDVGYDASLPARHPMVSIVDNVVYGTWISIAGSIVMHTPAGELHTFNPNPGVPARATSFTPIGSDTTPGVMYSRSRGGVFVELGDTAEVELTRCASGADSFLAMHSVPTGDPGTWLTGWATSTQDGFASEARLLVCSDDADCFAQACDVGETVLSDVRGSAHALMPGAGGGLWLATARSAVSGGQVALTLNVSQVDFADAGVDEPVVEVLDEFEVSSLPSGDPLEGPDWPELSFLPPNKLALSYIEPDAGLAVSALRVRRYEICASAD